MHRKNQLGLHWFYWKKNVGLCVYQHDNAWNHIIQIQRLVAHVYSMIQPTLFHSPNFSIFKIFFNEAQCTPFAFPDRNDELTVRLYDKHMLCHGEVIMKINRVPSGYRTGWVIPSVTRLHPAYRQLSGIPWEDSVRYGNTGPTWELSGRHLPLIHLSASCTWLKALPLTLHNSRFVFATHNNYNDLYHYKSLLFIVHIIYNRAQTHNCTKFRQNWSFRCGDIAIFRIFKMAAAAILDFWHRKISLIIWIQMVETHLRAKFFQNRSISSEDIKIFRFFKMAAVRHIGFVWGIFGPPTVSTWGSLSLCKIWLWSMQ